ncbi:oxysterol-binding protein-related protein 3/6/7, partial [Geosmithia morbida]
SYIVRWVHADEGHTLSWSLQPHKKSLYDQPARLFPLSAPPLPKPSRKPSRQPRRIVVPIPTLSRNFGIFKHPGTGATALLSSTGGDESTSAQTTEGKSGRLKRDTTAQDLLANKGFTLVEWVGKCEADKVSIGTHDVAKGEGGMYGLVFDNTFSKQTSKTATFVVLTYPTGSAPQTAHHIPNLQLPHPNAASQTSLAKHVPNLDGKASASSDSLPSHHGTTGGARPASARSDAPAAATGGSAARHVGTLSKRRRKKGQGYARRFFSLDYSTCTLSYYYNRNSSALRGAIPLSLAAVAADERRREISIDSGAEVWHLRAPNNKEFQDWAQALEKASRIARGVEDPPLPSFKASLAVDTNAIRTPQVASQQEEHEWNQVETLVSRLVGARDALRRLTKDIVKESQTQASAPSTLPATHLTPLGSNGEDKPEAASAPGTLAAERKPFWRRKSTASSTTPQQPVGATLAASTPGGIAPVDSENGSDTRGKGAKNQMSEEPSVPAHCQAILSDIDAVVAEFTTVITNSKRRRMVVPLSAGGASRTSMDTTASDEFFDAEDTASARVANIAGSDDESESDDSAASSHDTSSISSADDEDPAGLGDLYPSRPKSLTPLPIDGVVRRRLTIPEATVPPPSLIAFVRKNVGKDLSTISMPVSANEPISVLQKLAEQFEYAQLLTQAAKQKAPTERLLYVTAFAVSQFSSHRAKERAVRKPFTPLLGETYELVRSEQEVPGGFRLLAEKVQHRPLKLAMQAESAHWSFAQSPMPGNKFWGKSAEVTTDGRVRVALRLTDGSDEFYSWNIATMFLRNVVMGEKYLEPTGTMSVVNDSTGHKASVEFRGKGMWGGRVEEVHVTTFGPDGSNTGSGLSGNWTTGLGTVGPGKNAPRDEIWQVGKLVDRAPQTYGLTEFAAGLNEVTAIEEGKLAPTDSRLRPDQRLAEQGRLDDAENLKVKLEEAQRARRRELEERGEEYKPRWFVKAAENAAEGEEEWKMKTGKDSYWEERARGGWAGVEDLFHV